MNRDSREREHPVSVPPTVMDVTRLEHRHHQPNSRNRSRTLKSHHRPKRTQRSIPVARKERSRKIRKFRVLSSVASEATV